MSKNWQMKTQVACTICAGSGRDKYNSALSCHMCIGTGKVRQVIPPVAIDKFLSRPDKAEFICVCNKKESILRPTQGQIPSGWISWNSNLVCNKCKFQVILAALTAAANKVEQLKEKK